MGHVVLRRARPHPRRDGGAVGRGRRPGAPCQRPGRCAGDGPRRRTDFRDDVAARILARIGFYSPIRRARRITCPTLVQIATGDAITPAATARRAAERIPRGRYLEYPCEHFDPYVDPHFEKIVADQLEFCLSLTGPTA